MVLVDQDEFGNEGNCLSACLASLLGLDIADVPNFWRYEHTTAFWLAVEDWLGNHNLQYRMEFIPTEEANIVPQTEEVVIACGKGPRGLKHSVLIQNGKIIHDPHPDRSGLLSYEFYLRLQEGMSIYAKNRRNKRPNKD